jgi:5'-3' exonuclease
MASHEVMLPWQATHHCPSCGDNLPALWRMDTYAAVSAALALVEWPRRRLAAARQDGPGDGTQNRGERCPEKEYAHRIGPFGLTDVERLACGDAKHSRRNGTENAMGFGKGHHLHLIDGSAYIFRAYYALPPLTRKSDGLPVGAVAGFCNILWNELTRDSGKDAPTHIAVVFDHSSKTFRNDIYPLYKANRPELPEDLRPQFPLTREATRAFNVACLETENYEADDIIATLARQAVEAGGACTIISSDKDLMQLVGNGVLMRDPMKDRRIDVAEVEEKFGVGPDRVADVQALSGDSVDNVPGAPGIGIKTAALLIQEYGDLETLLARAGEIKQPKRREALVDNADLIRISKRLVTLDRDAPVGAGLDDLAVRLPDADQVMDFLQRMEFRTFTRRVAERLKVAAPAVPEGTAPAAQAARAAGAAAWAAARAARAARAAQERQLRAMLTGRA